MTNHKKMFIRILILTAAILGSFYFIGIMWGWFEIMCKPGGNCPTRNQIFLQDSLSLVPAAIMISTIITYVTEFLSDRFEN